MYVSMSVLVPGRKAGMTSHIDQALGGTMNQTADALLEGRVVEAVASAIQSRPRPEHVLVDNGELHIDTHVRRAIRDRLQREFGGDRQISVKFTGGNLVTVTIGGPATS